MVLSELNKNLGVASIFENGDFDPYVKPMHMKFEVELCLRRGDLNHIG